MNNKHVLRRGFPGRLTLEEWLSLKRPARVRLIVRAQCDLLGSFRFCTNKSYGRHRTCCGADPMACSDRLRSRRGQAARARLKARKRRDWRTGGMSKIVLSEWARLAGLAAL
jgi:hypothetical protein